MTDERGYFSHHPVPSGYIWLEEINMEENCSISSSKRRDIGPISMSLVVGKPLVFVWPYNVIRLND